MPINLGRRRPRNLAAALAAKSAMPPNPMEVTEDLHEKLMEWNLELKREKPEEQKSFERPAWLDPWKNSLAVEKKGGISPQGEEPGAKKDENDENEDPDAQGEKTKVLRWISKAVTALPTLPGPNLFQRGKSSSPRM